MNAPLFPLLIYFKANEQSEQEPNELVLHTEHVMWLAIDLS